MGFNIPMRTKSALNTNSLAGTYGTQNPANIKPAVNSGNLESLNRRSQSNNNQSNSYNNQPQNNNRSGGYNNQPQNNNRSGSYNNQPQNNNRSGSYTNQPQNNYQSNNYNNQPQNVQPAVPKKPAPHRKGNGMNILKGQKINIPVNKIKVGVGWNIQDSRCQLDSSAFMLGANNKVPSEDWFIFYGQPASPEQSIKYYLYEDNPSLNDDAELDIDLSRVDQNIQKIVISVTIYEAFAQRLHFGMVKNLYATIVNDTNNQEIARFELTECYPNVTAMIIGELYRYKGSWKFNAVGSGYNKDLAGFCGIYGVALE